MEFNGKRVLVCDCERTMPLDGKAVSQALAGEAPTVHHHLCRAQIESFRDAAADGMPLLVGCTQEVPVFLETLDEIDGAADARFVNIRERAGWSDEGAKAAPKITALIAEAALDIAGTPAVSMKSDGSLLVLGRDERAIDAARQVAGKLDVTVLLERPGPIVPPPVMDVPVFAGRARTARGHLGAFQVTIEDFRATRPSSRDDLVFEDDGKSGTSTTSLILDLRGETPLLPAPEKRDGYLNPDPGNPALIQKALFDLVDMVGTFDKPRYVDFQADLCAHARSQIVGCTRCLDVCPTGAITPGGDHVVIDPYVCAGCGTCASVCPTGAATFGLPAGDGVWRRLRTLLDTFRDAGGKDPVLLVHDTGAGTAAIDALARLGRGLPANLIPFAVNHVTQTGVDFVLTAMALGAAECRLLMPPNTADETEPLHNEMATANTILAGLGYGGDRVTVVDASEPTVVDASLWRPAAGPGLSDGGMIPLGRKREVLSLALFQLHRHAPTPTEMIALPTRAPFGAVHVDAAGCTLCLACVGACPTGALKDNPERPMLRFREDACVQCGLCEATCPENVIALEPRLNFADAAHTHVVVKEDDPYACIRCGKLFGTKSSIERLVDRLADHSMFADGKRLALLKMCDDCRIVAQMEDTDHPFAGPPRPATRTTDDDLRERDELRRQAAADMARRGQDDKGNGR